MFQKREKSMQAPEGGRVPSVIRRHQGRSWGRSTDNDSKCFRGAVVEEVGEWSVSALASTLSEKQALVE